MEGLFPIFQSTTLQMSRQRGKYFLHNYSEVAT